MKQINISQVSTFFANGSYPIEFLFYFPYRINTNRLRRALKKLSTHFWTVFGTYANGVITEKSYLEDEYFEEISVDEAFDPSMGRETIYNKFGTMNPKLSQHLFFLKVIHYINGTVLIPIMNHLVGDGYSYFYMLSVLAAVTKRGGIPLAPTVITAIAKPRIYSDLHASFHFTASPVEAITFENKIDVEYQEISITETRNQAKSISEKSGLRISTNDILSARVIKYVLENGKKKQLVNFRLAIPVDVRRGVSELGQRYFGNGLIMYNVPFNPKTVSQASIEELAITIRKSFPTVNYQSYETYLKQVENWIDVGKLELLRPYDPDTECLVTNLTRMPIKRLDFGSGPPTTVEPLTRGRSGAAILAQDDKFVLRLAR
ncbi:MAG: hypothetical protein GPJ52_11265 [Candidatus Heimdallarchaeota archaeon]|nr:hypothetical protein [Candidatus Heimdallarchaeota archaeon]